MTLPDGGSCLLTVIAPSGAGGTLVSYSATLSRTGAYYTASAGTLTGDIFGGTVTGISSNVAVTSSVNPSLQGQVVTFTATVAPSSATGSVTFKDGSTVICNTVPITGGVARCNAALTSTGTHPITASYSGDGTNAASLSAVFNQTVVDQTSKTVLAIGRFLGARNNQVLSNEPDAGRQINRLLDAGGESAGGTNSSSEAGFAATRSGTPSGGYVSGSSSRLGDGPDAADVAHRRFAGRDRSLGDIFGGYTQYDGNPYPVPSGGGIGRPGEPASLGVFGAPLGSSGNGRLADSTEGHGTSVTTHGLRFNGSFDGAMRFGFATSLHDVARAAVEADTRKAAVAGLAFAAARGIGRTARPNPFDIWVEGKYSSFSDSRSNSDLNGHFGLFSIGADYVLSRSLLVGTMVQFDRMQQRSNLQQTDVRGHGWMAGPYATLRLNQNVYLQARGAWGTSSNAVSPFQTYTDNFESQRWLVSSTLSGHWTNGAWSFRPSASVSYMEDVSKSFADTHGILIPSVKSTLGQAKAGPRVGYRFDLGHTVIEPHAGIQVIWNFARETTAVDFGQINGEGVGSAGVRGRAELGASATTASGISLDVLGSYDGIGATDYSAYTGRAVLRLPLN